MAKKRKVKLKDIGVEEDVMYGDVYTGADTTLAMSEESMSEEAGVMGVKIDPMKSPGQQQQEVDRKEARRKAMIKSRPSKKTKKKKSRKGIVSYKR